jgi:hypothetical protein
VLTKVEGMAHEASPLEVALKTDRASYKLGDEITVQVLLTNKSKNRPFLSSRLPVDGISRFHRNPQANVHCAVQEFDSLPPLTVR